MSFCLDVLSTWIDVGEGDGRGHDGPGVDEPVVWLASKRAAAGAWQKAPGHPPPGIKPSRSPI